MTKQAISKANFLRFLLTGCDTGVYRATGYQPAAGRAQTFLQTLHVAGPKVIDEITSFSSVRSEAALFCLALASSPQFAPTETTSLALAALPVVAPKAKDLIGFASYAAELRGWGRGLRSAIADWYCGQESEDLAEQILRRPAKNLALHRALLRRAHPKAASAAQNALFQWIANGGDPGHLAVPGTLSSVDGFVRMNKAENEREAVRCIEDCRLQPPQVPKRWKGSARVWEALFDHMGYRQLLRSLPVMTNCGLLSRGSEFTALAVARLADRRRIRSAGVRPLRAIEAMRSYRLRTPRPVESVFDALDEAFHVSLGQIEGIGKKVVMALDATGSMQGAPTLGMPEVPAALSAAAVGLSFAHAAGRHCVPLAFHRDVRALQRFDAKSHLTEALNDVRATPSRSDAEGVFRYAIENRIVADAFVVLTDRLDSSRLFDAFRQYREQANPETKLILVVLAGGKCEVPEDCGGAMVVSGMNTHHVWTAMSAFLQSSPL